MMHTILAEKRYSRKERNLLEQDREHRGQLNRKANGKEELARPQTANSQHVQLFPGRSRNIHISHACSSTAF